jgi:hypothetical protein
MFTGRRDSGFAIVEVYPKEHSRVAGIILSAPLFVEGSRQLERFSARIRVYNAE